MKLIENILFIALFIYLSNDTKIMKNMLTRRNGENFFCNHENTRMSMEFLTLRKYFWSLTVYIYSNLSRIMRKPDFFPMRKQTQNSCAVTAQLISAFVFTIYTDISFPFLPIFKILSLVFLCDCTCRFVSELIGNQVCWFSQAEGSFANAHVDYNYDRGRMSTGFRP